MEKLDIAESMKEYCIAGAGIALIQDGRISWKAGFGVLERGQEERVTANTMFNACSISKFAAAMLAMRLVSEDVLSLDEDVNRRLKSWRVPANGFTQPLTLRLLLSHQSGIKDPGGSFMELDFSKSAPSIIEILEGTTPYCTEPVHIQYEPGTEFHYSDAGFCVLEQLIHDVTGVAYEELLKSKVLKPLGMDCSTLNVLDAHAAAGHDREGSVLEEKHPVYPYMAAAGLWSSAADLGKLYCELLNAVNGKSKLSISQNIAEEMIRAQGCSPWTGLGVFVNGQEISSLGWGKGFQCMGSVYPRLGKGAIIMTNTDTGVHQRDGWIGKTIGRIL
ncbi:serine hydrolase domain-containing protein [Bacillus sp. SJS]|uniref:serine hydrolase domain-containing protein n=1 Tax=Bacillus sp. SJS TaxID=1423321 RepID=UPI000AE0FA07|nr:serine hydrolase domain-containing protein [Bacillus sp. SJS]